MHRFVIDPGNIDGNLIKICGDDLKHLRLVLRLKTGDKIQVFDGREVEYEAVLTDVNKERAYAEILSSYRPDTEPRIKLTLFQGLPKGDKMDLIIQKSVELGVHRIVPVLTERTVVQLDSKSGRKKTERWNRIAKEAAKQCRRAYIPEVGEPIKFAEVLKKVEDFDAAVMMYENEEKKCLKELLKCYTINKIEDIAIFIGSEGGFSTDEVKRCKTAGFDIVSLGKRVLRTETAAISAVSIIMYEMGELQ
ncbi:MAG: 16S rRNA (uracil(1498)-N(3))-methyltransferase [Clostridiaceae bacterium]|mgnify:CR=1 FL=1|nr:16S rRNA (uracil(1498)-N(3))-methyltransferase [Clostridiaceae bacterium]